MRTRLLFSPLAACLLVGIASLAAPAAFASTFTVNATDDTSTFSEIGPCTSTHCNLRQAITAANAASVCSIVTFTCTQQTVNFNLPRSLVSIFNGTFFFAPPAPIKLNPELLAISVTKPLIIDGTTQPGYVASPTVVLQPAAFSTAPQAGLVLEGSGGSLIRGLAFQNFKGTSGIVVNSSNNTIVQNYFGTDSSGSTSLGNADAIVVIGGNNNKIGFPTLGNVISGNAVGIFLNGGGGTLVQGNLIGTNPAGTAAVPNSEEGVLISSDNDFSSTIGGLNTGEGNVIAFNGGPGIDYTALRPQHVGQAIRGNSIFSNAGLGIDQRNITVPVQAPPSLTGSRTGYNVVPSGFSFRLVPFTVLSGTVTGKPNSTLSLDFFDNDACDPSGNGEGQGYVSSQDVTTDGSGNASFSVQLSGTFSLATATATSAANSTSVFSNCRFVSSGLTTGTPHLAPTSATTDVHQRITYTYKWTVPSPETWHDLTSLQLRIRNDAGTALQLKWDAATNTFSAFNPSTGKYGPAFAPATDRVLETSDATVYLKDSSVKGAGPTAPTVTLTLSIGFKPGAASSTYVVEVAATDDRGHSDDFSPAGVLEVDR